MGRRGREVVLRYSFGTKIIMKQQIHDIILPEKIGIQVCPFSTRWRLAHEQILALNEWIDKQFPIEKDERQSRSTEICPRKH